MNSEAAENLVLGTAIQESNLTHLIQLGGGPALGLYQMEPATHDDLKKYITRKGVQGWVQKLPAEAMIGDLDYATAMCRIHYWRRPEPLPGATDALGMSLYWKRFYNTEAGAGVPEGFERLYRAHVL